MNIKVNYQKFNNVFAVPKSLVDEEIRLCGALQLKVILWIFSHQHESITESDIAKALGVDVLDVTDALQYWKLKNYIESEETKEKEPDFFDFVPAEKEPPKPEPAPTPVNPQPTRIIKPDSKFIAERITQSDELSWLMQETQVILGKALSPSLSSLLISIYDDFGLPADVILMIISYSKIKGRASTSYIEAVARNWAEEEIFSHALAEEKLKRLDEASKAWGKICDILRLERRSPSKKEEEFSNRWINDWKFSPAMILESYNRCIDSTSKLSFSYMNKVLENWYKKGIKTVSDIAKADMKAKPKKEEEKELSFDIDELDRIIRSL